jgi:L-lactate dehydrogenase complex protein LldE
VRIGFFAPCYVDQLYPRAAIAAIEVLERLGVDVEVPADVACCGQPAANAGFEGDGESALRVFVRAFTEYEHVVVLSGSCALHVRSHSGSVGAEGDGRGALVGERTMEFCSFLHDVVGVDRVKALGAVFRRRIAVHIGCHGLRGLGLASPSELRGPRFNKVCALLEGVEGLSFADVERPDECCGFGGSFAVTEPAVSARMGRDRLRDWAAGGAEALVSTDMSCLMHLEGLGRRDRLALPMMHVAEVLATREP